MLRDCEDVETIHGQTWKRPQVSTFTASGAAQTENAQLSDSTSTLLTLPGQQSFGVTPTYTALLSASLQLIQDAIRQDISSGKGSAWNPINGQPATSYGAATNSAPAPYSGVPTGSGDLVDLLASAGGESIGRQLASALSTAIYGAGFTAQQVSLGSLTASNVIKLIGVLDPTFLPGAKFYMSAADAATVFSGSTGVLLNSDGLHLGGIPVVVTNACTNWVNLSVSGPILANLRAAWTARRVRNGITVQVMPERYADFLQVGINVYGRFDFQPTGRATAIAFSK